jgi:hypothetical protein
MIDSGPGVMQEASASAGRTSVRRRRRGMIENVMIGMPLYDWSRCSGVVKME